MKLYFSSTSPYARKVRMVMIEKGLADRVELISANPFELNPALKAANPLHKVPALVTDSGQVLFDSRVICAWLDAQTATPALVPAGDQGWPVQTAAAMADGMLDALFALVMERRRDATAQSPYWMSRWRDAFLSACDHAEAQMAPMEGSVSLAQIGLGAALGYADFRTPDIDWRDGRSTLAAWFKRYSQRPSMRQTEPSG